MKEIGRELFRDKRTEEGQQGFRNLVQGLGGKPIHGGNLGNMRYVIIYAMVDGNINGIPVTQRRIDCDFSVRLFEIDEPLLRIKVSDDHTLHISAIKVNQAGWHPAEEDDNCVWGFDEIPEVLKEAEKRLLQCNNPHKIAEVSYVKNPENLCIRLVKRQPDT